MHSWDQHIQQHRRLDLDDLRLIERMESFGIQQTVTRDHLVSFDVDRPHRRPAWGEMLVEHEQMHRPHMGNEEI